MRAGPVRMGLLVGMGILSGRAAQSQKPTVRVRTPDGMVRVRQRGAVTVLVWTPRHGVARSLVLPKQEGIYAHSFWSVEWAGSPGPGVFVLETTYDSRPGGPTLQCGAGQETYLRVVDFAGKGRQVLAELVDSCWSSIEGTDWKWNAEDHTLLVDKHDYGKDKMPHTRTVYHVDVRVW